jgi:hypothetical protein
MNLTQREHRFVEEYLVDLNATAAYARAGNKPDPKGGLAARLLRSERVRIAVDEAIAQRSERVQIDQDRVLLELARIAFVDFRELFEIRTNESSLTGAELYLEADAPSGVSSFEHLSADLQVAWNAAAAAVAAQTRGCWLKRPDALDDSTAAAIARFEVRIKKGRDGQPAQTYKIAFFSKTKALYLLGRHLGLWDPRVQPYASPAPWVSEHGFDEEIKRGEELLAKARLWVELHSDDRSGSLQ